jgi:alanyl-tRNA synthetase
VFTPIMDAFAKMTGKRYGGKLDDMVDIGFRVVADHVRMLVFALTDGALPSNKGRGAVVRSVLRRAFRFGYQFFNQRKPFICRLVPAVVEQMEQAFPNLEADSLQATAILELEEMEFLKTIERGIGLFNEWADLTKRIALGDYITGEGTAVASSPKFIHPREVTIYKESGPMVMPAEPVFRLHTTHGFPPDLTRQMAAERGLRIDEVGYKKLMKEHEETSRAGEKKHVVVAIQGDLPPTDDSSKYAGLRRNATIAAWVKGNLVGTSSLACGDQVGLVLDQTNFYAEQGGQVGDAGWIKTDSGSFEVEDTQRLGDSVIHWGKVFEGTIKTGQKATLEVDPARLDIMRNHTATHLMNWALRKVLGDHVEQKGSLVDAEKTRFDFTHDKPMTADEFAEVERLVNDEILANLPVTAVNQPLAQAKAIPGVRAVFGEKYPDPVRVVTTGESVEFCGGTHLTRTSQACLFKIVSQEGVAKGVRRITAVTGPKAIAHAQQLASVVGELAERFHCRPEELPTRVGAMQEEIKHLQQQLRKGAASDLAGTMDKLLDAATKVGDVSVIVGEIPGGPDDAIRSQVDRVKQTAGSSVVVVGWIDGEKVGLLAAVSDDVVKKGIKAGDLIKQIAPIVGGGGGGRPNMAQAGGKDPAKLGDALTQARNILGEQLAK